MTQPQTHPTLVVTGGDLDGTSFIVLRSAKEMLLGSSQDCHFQILLGNVEAVHAKVAWGPKGLRLSDALSTAGTFVNGEKIGEDHVLTDGDRISLGPPGSKSSCKLVVRIPTGLPRADEELVLVKPETGLQVLPPFEAASGLEPARAHDRPHPRADRSADRRGPACKRPRRPRIPPRTVRSAPPSAHPGAPTIRPGPRRPRRRPHRRAKATAPAPRGASPGGEARLRDRAALDRTPEGRRRRLRPSRRPAPASEARRGQAPARAAGRGRLPLYVVAALVVGGGLFYVARPYLEAPRRCSPRRPRGASPARPSASRAPASTPPRPTTRSSSATARPPSPPPPPTSSR